MDTQYIKTMGEPFSIYQANRRHTIWCQQDRSRATTISHTLIPCTQIGLCMPCANQYHYNNVIMNAIACQITASRFFTQALIQAHIKEKKSKLRVTGPCEGNSPVTGEFPAQGASNAENVSIWWLNHASVEINRSISNVYKHIFNNVYSLL